MCSICRYRVVFVHELQERAPMSVTRQRDTCGVAASAYMEVFVRA